MLAPGTSHTKGKDVSDAIDANMVKLVDVLNEFPGIITFSSCGGHPGPREVSQAPAGTFYVNFELDVLLGGWRSLEIFAVAIQETEAAEPDAFSITVWDNGGLCFELQGKSGANPDALASVLCEMRDEYDAKGRIDDVPISLR